MYTENWSDTTFDGEAFQLMTTSGTEFLDNTIGADSGSKTPWYWLNSITQFEFQQTNSGSSGGSGGSGGSGNGDNQSTRPVVGQVFPRGY